MKARGDSYYNLGLRYANGDGVSQDDADDAPGLEAVGGELMQIDGLVFELPAACKCPVKAPLVNWLPWSVLKISGGPWRASASSRASTQKPASRAGSDRAAASWPHAVAARVGPLAPSTRDLFT